MRSREFLFKVPSVGKLDLETGITYPEADEVTGSREATDAAVKDSLSQGTLTPEVHDLVAACSKCAYPRNVRERCPYCG